jgi:hypothetical protein
MILTEDSSDRDLSAYLDAEDRALAIHEAGHAVVALALNLHIRRVALDNVGGGSVNCATSADRIERIAMCAAGWKAEQRFGTPTPMSKKRDDVRKMCADLAQLPLLQRRAARLQGFKLAEEKIRVSTVRLIRIADALLSHHELDHAAIERIS